MILLRILRRIGPPVGWLALLAGVLLQAWLKDRHESTALFFYAMPKPCLAALAITLLVWPGAAKISRIFAALATIAMVAWWFSASWKPGPRSESAAAGQELKVLYWNLCRPHGLDEEMIEMVQRHQPDIAAFVEPGSSAHELAPEYQRRLPGYTVTFIPRGVLWVTRLPSELRKRGKLEEIGAFAAFEVVGRGPAFRFVVADVFPHVFRSREGQLMEALEQAQGRSDAIMVGDFNTPAESVLFEPYQRQLVNAFDVAGQGFRETWPIGLPLLSLDHVWAGRDWTVTQAEKVCNLRGSDHAALVVTLRR